MREDLEMFAGGMDEEHERNHGRKLERVSNIREVWKEVCIQQWYDE